MDGKSKPRRTIFHIARRLVVSLLAGAVFLALVGSLVAAAIEISKRHRSVEEMVDFHLQESEQPWYLNSENVEIDSDVTITERHWLEALNVAHLEFSWWREFLGEREKCQRALLAQNYADMFGGWRILFLVNSFCGKDHGWPIKYLYWESAPLEFPHRYYLYAYSDHTRAVSAEVTFMDDGIEQFDIDDGIFNLIIAREAPFQVKSLSLLAEGGYVLYKQRLE